MVSSLNGLNNTSSIKMFNAMQAFKPHNVEGQEPINQEISDGIDVKDSNDILQNQNVQEIQDIAKGIGDNDISEDDIKYGLTYGRSVIADYSA